MAHFVVSPASRRKPVIAASPVPPDSGAVSPFPVHHSLDELVRIIAFLHQQGWTPATSSNFSIRTAEAADDFLISASGKDKGSFTADDFLTVDLQGKASPGETRKPSAETLLHAMAYRNFPNVGSVLHTHSIAGTVLSKLYEGEGQLVLRDFEILKGFEGIQTHEAQVIVPIFSNSQDMITLSREVEQRLLQATAPVYGFLLAGHGLYTWGETPAQAKRHVEVFEFLMACVLKLRSYGYPVYS